MSTPLTSDPLIADFMSTIQDNQKMSAPATKQSLHTEVPIRSPFSPAVRANMMSATATSNYSIFTVDEEAVIQEISLKAVSVLKANVTDFENRLTNCRTTVKDMLSCKNQKAITAGNYCRIHDEILLRSVRAITENLPYEEALYDELSSHCGQLNKLSASAKFLSFLPIVTRLYRTLSKYFVNRAAVIVYLVNNWANIKNKYFPDYDLNLEICGLNVNKYFNYFLDTVLCCLVFLDSLNYFNVWSEENTIEKVANQVTLAIANINNRINRIKTLFGYIAEVDEPCINLPGVVDVAAAMIENQTSTQINFYDGFVPEFIPKTELDYILDNIDDDRSWSSMMWDPVPTGAPTEEHLKERIQEHLGSYPEFNSIIETGSTVAISPSTYIGLESQKSPDVSVLNNPGVSVVATTNNRLKDKVSNMYLVGPITADVIPGCFNKSKSNERIALLGRHIHVTKSEHNLNWKSARKIHFNKFIHHLGLSDVDNFTKSFDQWLVKLPKSKADQYVNSKAKLSGIDFSNKRYHTREFFLKLEVLPPPKNGKLAEKAPRGIQGLKNPESNMYMGCFIGAVSKMLAESYNEQNRKFYYTSGSNYEDIGAWYHEYSNKIVEIDKKGVKHTLSYSFIEDDFSAYDSTQGQGAYETEMEIYDHVLKTSTLDAGVKTNVKHNLHYQANTVGSSTFFNYSVPHTRKSGDQNTSVGNTLVNFFAHYVAIESWNMANKNKRKIHDYSMLGLGDDNLIAMAVEPALLPEIMEHIRITIEELGLKPTLVNNKYPSYCSSYFMPVVNGAGLDTHVLVPSVTRSLTKLGWSTNPLLKTTPLERMKGNMLGISMYRISPVMRIFYDYYTNLDVDGSVEYQYRSHELDSHSHNTISAKTMDWFADLYQISLAEISELESYLKSSVEKHEGRPFVWSHAVFRKMLE